VSLWSLKFLKVRNFHQFLDHVHRRLVQSVKESLDVLLICIWKIFLSSPLALLPPHIMASPLINCLRRLPVIPARASASAPFKRKRIQHVKSFTSAAVYQEELQDFKAAAELELDNPVFNHEHNLLDRIRIVPKSSSYFSAKSVFVDTYVHIEHLYQTYNSLPKIDELPRIKWLSFEDMKARVGVEKIKMSRFDIMIRRLQELSAIEPMLMPPEVKQTVENHMTEHQLDQIQRKEVSLDEWGRSIGSGRRKASTARAWLVMGNGQIIINGRNIADHFGRLHDRESALWALKITNRMDKYNVFAVVSGGGVTGQAEALTLAIAKSLLVHEPELEERLRDSEYRDAYVIKS
jgi:small subunit ribosomal protein S9